MKSELSSPSDSKVNQQAPAQAVGAGKVYLVGAGPGDPGLLTRRAFELMQEADLIVYDALVSPEVLKLAPKSIEKLYAGKRSSQHAIPQQDLNELLADRALEGKKVVRLKGGDPYVFGRGGEEAQTLVRRGVSFEVVPGISSIVAAPAYAGIPLTHRDHCSGFMVITGHEEPGKAESSVNWEAFAKFQGSKVVLMGVERIRSITDLLLEHGESKDTPVGMVRWGTTGRQEALIGTVGTIADLVAEKGFKAPAVTLIGGVVGLREQLNWFENRPLFGKRIVVTRTREQASRLSSEFAQLGASVFEIPTIRIEEPSDFRPMMDVILGLNSYNWLVFTSPNGVTRFFHYFFRTFDDIRDFGGARIAAVGPATVAKLKELHLKVDVVPEKFVGSALPDAMAKFESLENLTIAILRAEVGGEDLPKRLEELGGIVDDVACYKTVPEVEDVDGALEEVEKNGADWITFTSSSTVENFHERSNIPDLLEEHPGLKVASIGPETSKALKALGIEPHVEAKKSTIDGLVEAILAKEK